MRLKELPNERPFMRNGRQYLKDDDETMSSFAAVYSIEEGTYMLMDNDAEVEPIEDEED